MLPRAVCVALILLVSLAVAGCGGPLSKHQYEQRVAKIGCRAETSLNKVIRSNAPPTASNLRDAQDVFAKAADDLDSLNAPKSATTGHRLMVKGLRELAKTFGHLGDKVSHAKTPKDRAEVFMQTASDSDTKRAFEDLSKARDEFDHRGYHVFDSTSACGGGTPPPAATTATVKRAP